MHYAERSKHQKFRLTLARSQLQQERKKTFNSKNCTKTRALDVDQTWELRCKNSTLLYEYYETTDHRPLHIGTKYQLYIYGTVKPRVVTRVYDGLILTTQRGSRWKMWCKVIQRCKPPHRRCMSQTGPAFSLGHRVSPHTRTFGSQPYSHTLPQSAVLMVSTSAVHAIHELLLIYRLGRDGRLSCLVGWPTTDSLPWSAVHQRLGTGKVRRAKDRRSNDRATLPTNRGRD